jgi:hypothetical protein
MSRGPLPSKIYRPCRTDLCCCRSLRSVGYMHSPFCYQTRHVRSPAPSSPVFGFSPRLAVDRSTGDTFVALGSSVLVFDARHKRLLSQRRIFSYGGISYISRSDNCLVAASGSRLSLWTDVARAEGAAPQIIDCGMTRVLVCAYSRKTAYPLVALLQAGCPGAGIAIHFSTSSDMRLIAAKTVNAPEWQSRTGGMCSCACVVVDNGDSHNDRFVCASGV